MSKPVAVLISDVHFNLTTLGLASAALTQARDKACELGVPLVIAGDLNDTKAIIRAEVANQIIQILSLDHFVDGTRIYILVGNHDLANEKGEAHGLNYLRPFAQVVQSPVFIEELGSWLIPYQNSADKLTAILNDIPKGSRLIMHQGVMGAFMGEYVVDKTSLPKEAFADFRVISGHYHRAQDIKCGRPRKGAVGLFTYIGSPYSVSFAEAHDGPKGFRVLYEDGFLESVPTNLRKHVIIDTEIEMLDAFVSASEAESGVSSRVRGTTDNPGALNQKAILSVTAGDLVWLKVRGPASELAKVNKKDVGLRLFGTTNYKLDKITTEMARLEKPNENLTELQILEKIIDQTGETVPEKKILKDLAKEMLAA